MHLWQEYHRSRAVFSVQPIRWHMIYLIIYFDYFIIVASAWLLHFKVTLFPFEINKYFVGKYFETKWSFPHQNFNLFIYVSYFTQWIESLLYLLLQWIYSHILASDNLLKLDPFSFWHGLIILWTLPCFLAPKDAWSCTFPVSVLEQARRPK